MKKLTVFLAFALLLIAQAYAQSPRTVTGKVTDDKGTPLSGVTISAVGVNKNALSDNNGSFSIQVTEKVKSLKITYVGFQIDVRQFFAIADVFILPSYRFFAIK